MKTLKNKFWALLLIASVAFLSCKKQDPLPPMQPVNNSGTISTNNPNFTQGQWIVELFQEGGTVKTSDFRGYLFTFNNNGSVQVKKDNNTFTGVWSTDKESNRLKFKISFASDPLRKLSEDWEVKSETNTSLKMEHMSGGNGGVDYLTFGRYFSQGDIGNFQ